MASKAQWKTETHTFKYPVIVDDTTYTTITLREPDVDALEKIEALGVTDGSEPTLSQLRGTIAAVADLPNEVIGKIHRDDFLVLGEMIAPLLAGELALGD